MVRNARWLWIVIALMAFSLFGTIFVQYSLIQSTITSTAEKFEKEVFAALTNTVKTVVDESSFEDFRHTEIWHKSQVTDTTDVSKNMTAHRLRLTDFIVLPSLDYLLRQNLRKRGVDLEYHYGVYSYATHGYVIMDGSYTIPVEEEVEASVASKVSDLQASPYRADMFVMDTSALGELVLFFPKREGKVFSTVILQVIAALFFIILILFCFGYTINIILAQKQLSLMKTDFINNMTHEFKTPIATISLAADSIKNPSIRNNPDQVDGFIDIIRQENKRMHNHVEAVLRIAKLDRNELELNVERLDVVILLKKCIRHFDLLLKKSSGKIELTCAEDEVFIYGDATHLSNLVHNLLDNALKYVKGPPEVTIHVRADKKQVTLSFIDNGIGMDGEEIKFIFDKFYRVPTGNVHNIKGFGLGLAYVKAIVDAHKGSIQVESELGVGSKFILSLPRGSL